MARRKAWADLSPAYRRRLERSGITAETHAEKRVNISTARGHGIHTKSEQRNALQRARTASIPTLIDREMKLGYFASNAVLGFMDELGKQRFAAVLSWQEMRYNAKQQLVHSRHTAQELDNISSTFPTLQQYVEEQWGDEAWDSIFSDWWDEVGDLVMWSWYN